MKAYLVGQKCHPAAQLPSTPPSLPARRCYTVSKARIPATSFTYYRLIPMTCGAALSAHSST
jgi:hypothetical protein